jgi:hypothetical protein
VERAPKTSYWTDKELMGKFNHDRHRLPQDQFSVQFRVQRRMAHEALRHETCNGWLEERINWERPKERKRFELGEEMQAYVGMR